MNRNSKKGFTIVELIIVIAVIAVLAAVLIPTFSNLIQKANEAKDTSLVSNLNKAVAMDTGKHETVYDVLTAVRENAGYDVEKINASATNNEILWDSANNCFVYSVNGDIKYIPDTKTTDVKGEYDYWKISSKQDDITEGKYSIYWTGANLTGTVEVTTGFDVGETTITSILYKGVKTSKEAHPEVTIRTNGGTLEINAANDSVNHYYLANNVTIKAVYAKSYHEHGTVAGNLEVNAGRVVVENGANVSALVVDPAESAKVEVASNGGNVAAVVSTKEVGSDVVIPDTLQPTVIDETKKNEMNLFAGGIGTEASPYLIETAEQLLKINELYGAVDNAAAFQNLSKYEGDPYYFKQIANIETSSVEGEKYVLRVFTGEYDGNGYTLKLKEHANSLERHSFIQTIFGKIVLKNMEVNLENGAAYTLISINDFTTNNPQLVAELNGITVDSNATVSLSSGIYGIFWSNYAKNFKSIKFIDCVNKANVSNGGTTTGVFTGSGWSMSDNGYNETAKDVSVKFINCANYGNIVGKNQVGVIYGHRQYVTGEIENDCYSFVEVNNVVNSGKIKATDKDGCARFAPVFDNMIEKDRFAKYTTDYQSLYSVGDNVFDVDGVVVTVNLSNNQIATNAEGIEFKVAYVVTSMFYDGVPSNTTEYTYDLTKVETTTATVNKFIARNATSQEKFEYDSYGIYFNVLSSGETEMIFVKEAGRTFGANDTTSSVSLFVKAYDATGMLIGTIKI